MSKTIKKTEIPRFISISQDLRNKVLSGHFQNGERIPSEIDLCDEHDVSRITIQRAMQDLIEDGLLHRQQGSGTYVNIKRTEKQQMLVGMLMFAPSGLYTTYDELEKGVKTCAAEHGYDLMVTRAESSVAQAIDKTIRHNESKPVGTLFVPLQCPKAQSINSSIMRAIVGTNQKMVVVDTQVQGMAIQDVPYITSENRKGMYDLTHHLIKLGHKRLAFLAGPDNNSIIQRRLGFTQAIEEAHLELRLEYCLKVAGDEVCDQGKQEVDVFMAMRERPDVIVCCNDLIALNVVERCKFHGLRIPQDIAVTGFDDLPQAAISNPPLTTVHQHLYEMGYRAMELLISQIRGQQTSPVRERLSCELVIRQSCGS